MITIHSWRIYPELRLARNVQSGAYAELDPYGDNDWQLSCVNCSGQLKELADWWSQNLPTDRKIITDTERYQNNYNYIIITKSPYRDEDCVIRKSV